MDLFPAPCMVACPWVPEGFDRVRCIPPHPRIIRRNVSPSCGANGTAACCGVIDPSGTTESSCKPHFPLYFPELWSVLLQLMSLQDPESSFWMKAMDICSIPPPYLTRAGPPPVTSPQRDCPSSLTLLTLLPLVSPPSTPSFELSPSYEEGY